MQPSRRGFAIAGAISCIAVAIAWYTRLKGFGRVVETFPLSGSGSYIDIAAEWVGGEALDNGRPPAYTLFLSFFIRLFAGDYALPASLAQAAIAAGLLVAVWRAGGWFAFACAAANLALLREFVSARETLLAAAFSFAAFALLARPDPPTPRRAFAIMLAASMAWLTRPTGFLCVGAAGAILAWQSRTHPAAPRIARAMAAGLLPLALWIGYQVRAADSVHIAGKSSAVTLYYGVHEALPAVYPLIDVDNLDPYIHAEEATWPERDAGYRSAFARRWSDAPAACAQLALRKAAAFFVPLQFPLGDGTPVRATDGSWQLPDYRLLGPAGLLLGLSALPGIAAFFLALLRWPRLAPHEVFAVAIVAGTAAIHIVTFAETRYRQPLDPMLAVLAAGMLRNAKPKEARDAGRTG